MLRLFGLAKESITDGPGIRYAIFTQGCPHYCEGCHNQESLSFTAGYWVEESEIVREIAENPLLDGITLSGGEPFMQAPELVEIAKSAREMGLQVMTYSGYAFEELLQLSEERSGYKDLMMYTDILIDGKFELDKKSLDLRYRGSSNQRAIDMKRTLEEGVIVLFPL